MEAKANTLQLKYLNELAKFYAEQRQFEKAYSYNSNFIAQTKSLDSANSQLKISPYEIERNDLQQLDSINVLKQRQAVQAATIKQDNIMLWISLAALLIISVSLSFVYRQYRTNKKTLESLRKTQQQLVLAEKMASLGELTAGIAHEIQNPLNFINNFSEVNKELLTEMDEEIQKGNFEGVKLLAKDVISNQEKINHHGKRADAIVKSMLQHSRKSTGQKELIDVNEMCEEYLRLAYHGLRAKDKSFNAKFETNLDPTAGKVNIIAQDVGRVILNLINNAFYAVNEKKNSNSVSNYEPEVTIGTKKINSDVVITVRDNGTGIKQEVIDKIFQPFFTTKPTGLGTGLGLSLSYDIVKAHGGEIKVESIVGEGTTFTIKLPS
ncbi:MAG TPA: two-component sensor histidine kinase [Cytophagales bacterium]|nr:two-component sensor histidine kinase [Cytophagales bacterium]